MELNETHQLLVYGNDGNALTYSMVQDIL